MTHEEDRFDDGAEDRLVARLRREGVLGRSPRSFPAIVPWTAAAALFVAGLAAGRYLASRGSLGSQLKRTNLAADQRLELLERAGSAFERASEIYSAGEAVVAPAGTKTVRVLWF